MKRNQIELTEHALIVNRRKTVPRRNIRALSWCPDCLIQHGGRETDDRDRSLVLAADLDTPAGRLLNKGPFIVLPLSPDTDPSALTDWAGDLFRDHADTKDFSADSVVVEAKIKVNDYTKAATAGTNAYGKIGMTSPIIETEFSIPDGNIHIHYLGTSSKMYFSRYFRENPEHDFNFRGAELLRPVLRLHYGRITAVMEMEYPSIERDEHGSGIWQVHAEKSFTAVSDACAWLRTLHSKTAPRPTEYSTEDAAPHFTKSAVTALLSNLDSLYRAGILSELEYQAKKELILSLAN